MTKYHNSPVSGKMGRCRAKDFCPYGPTWGTVIRRDGTVEIGTESESWTDAPVLPEKHSSEERIIVNGEGKAVNIHLKDALSDTPTNTTVSALSTATSTNTVSAPIEEVSEAESTVEKVVEQKTEPQVENIEEAPVREIHDQDRFSVKAANGRGMEVEIDGDSIVVDTNAFFEGDSWEDQASSVEDLLPYGEDFNTLSQMSDGELYETAEAMAEDLNTRMNSNIDRDEYASSIIEKIEEETNQDLSHMTVEWDGDYEAISADELYEELKAKVGDSDDDDW